MLGLGDFFGGQGSLGFHYQRHHALIEMGWKEKKEVEVPEKR